MEVPVYYFFYGDFPDVNLFSSRNYIHVVAEVTGECLFDPAEVPSLNCVNVIILPVCSLEDVAQGVYVTDGRIAIASE